MEALKSPYVILHLVLPFLCVLSFGRSAPKRGFGWCLMAGVTLYHSAVLFAALILGHLEVLYADYYAGALLAVGVVALGFSLAGIPSVFRALLALRYKFQWVDIPLAACVLLFLQTTWLEIKFDWTEGPVFFDSMAYHVPRVTLWHWHANFHPWRTAVWHQIGNVIGGSASMLPLALMGRGWLGGSWAGVVAAYGSAAAVFVIARSFNLSVRSALLGALCFMACPVVGLRFSDLSTDIAAALPVLAGVALFRTLTPLGRGIFYFIALSGVGVACKQYVAIPVFLIALVLFIPRTKEILCDKKTLLNFFGGVTAAAVICVLSFFPMYEAFGTLSGGSEGLQHSSFIYGWGAVWRVTKVMFVNWMLEPLSLVQLLERLKYIAEGTNEALFNAIHGPWLYTTFCQSLDVWPPVFTPFNTRTGFIPLVLLPWLIFSVKKGSRLLVTVLFIALFLTQVSIFSINYWASRFTLLALAAFSLLWASRAQKNPILVSLFVFGGLFSSYSYVEPMRRELYGYHPNKEHMREALPIIKEDPVVLLSAALTNDGHIGGRLGQVHYEYIVCPEDGNWNRQFTELKSRTKWLIIPGGNDLFKPGPAYESRLGPVCPNARTEELKRHLTETGWRYKLTMTGLYELWTWTPEA